MFKKIIFKIKWILTEPQNSCDIENGIRTYCFFKIIDKKMYIIDFKQYTDDEMYIMNNDA